MGKIKKWFIAAITLTSVILSGYQVGLFDVDRGYPLVDGNGDTTWYADSSDLVARVDSITRWEWLLSKGVDTSIVWAHVKRHDETVPEGKEYLGIKSGMAVDYIDPFNYCPVWISDTTKKPSDYSKGIYVYAEVKRSYPSFDELFTDTGRVDSLVDVDTVVNNTAIVVKRMRNVPSPGKYKRRKFYVDFDELEKETKIVGLANKIKSGVVVHRKINKDIAKKVLKSTWFKDFKKVFDINATTEGYYTIGGGGAGVDSFATWAAGYADLGNFTDDLTYCQTSDVTETAGSTVTEDLNGHTFTCTSNNPHYGDPTKGWQISMNGGSIQFVVLSHSATGGGTIEIKNLRLKSTVARASRYDFYVGCTDACNINIHDNMSEGNETYMFQVANGTAAVTLKSWNCVGWNATIGFLILGNLHANSRIENNTFYNNSSAGMNLMSKTGTFNNNVCVGNGTDYIGIDAATGSNNASEDATAADANWSAGSNNQINVVPATEFVSLDNTNKNFLKLTNAGVLWNGGTPGISTHGIRGNVRAAIPSIGADEYGLATETNNAWLSPWQIPLLEVWQTPEDF